MRELRFVSAVSPEVRLFEATLGPSALASGLGVVALQATTPAKASAEVQQRRG